MIEPRLVLPGVEVYIGDALETVKALAALYPKKVSSVVCSPPYLWKRNYSTGHWEGGNQACKHPAPAWADDPGSDGVGQGNGLSANAMKWLKRTGGVCPTCGAKYVDRQIGIEPTLEEYITRLCDLFDGIRHYLLREDGSIWVNLADTFSGSGGAGGDYNPGGLREGQPKWRPGKSNVPRKSLMFVPERFAIAMVDRGWICRNKPIWFKGRDVGDLPEDDSLETPASNGMPISAEDRLKETYENWYHFTMSNRPVRWVHQRQGKVVTKKPRQEYEELPDGRKRSLWISEDYFYDLDSARKKHAGSTLADTRPGLGGGGKRHEGWVEATGDTQRGFKNAPNPLGSNPGDLWMVPTTPFPLAHFACFPPGITEIPVKTTVPEAICQKCGTPRQAIYTVRSKPAQGRDQRQVLVPGNREQQSGFYWEPPDVELVGYSDCGCNAGWEGAILLDPFFGSGATAEGAFKARPPVTIDGHLCQPKVIGIDLDERNLSIIEKRLTGRAKPSRKPKFEKYHGGGFLAALEAEEKR